MANGKPGRPATGRRKYWNEGVTGRTRAQAIHILRANPSEFKSVTNILRIATNMLFIKLMRAGWKLPTELVDTALTPTKNNAKIQP